MEWRKRMRILFLCHGAGNGGAERVITTLAGAFAEKEYEVELVTTSEPKNDYVLNTKIHHSVIISNKGNVLLRTVDRILQLRKIIKTTKPSCIVSFSSIPNMQAIVASYGLKAKLIISERTDPSRYPSSKVGKILRNLLYPLADRIVFQTNEAKEYFSKKIQSMSTVISNPIRDDLPMPYLGKREKRIVGIGSLGEQKNWDVALEAGKVVFKEHPEYIMDIYGEGPYRERLQKEIDSNEYLSNHVFLKGFSSNVVEEMLKATMYISSSDYEGISNAMLEALAVGVPTICTDCPVGGARENITNGVDGLLVSVGNPLELANAMIKLIETPELQTKLSKNSIDIKNKLKLERIFELWENECK